MGVAIGLILAAFGAILTWAVNADVSGLNVRTYVRDTRYPDAGYPPGTVPPARGRRVVVDEEVGGPVGPPPP